MCMATVKDKSVLDWRWWVEILGFWYYGGFVVKRHIQQILHTSEWMFHVNYMHDPLPKHKWLFVIFYCCFFGGEGGFHISGPKTVQYFYCTYYCKLHEKVHLDVILSGFN